MVFRRAVEWSDFTTDYIVPKNGYLSYEDPTREKLGKLRIRLPYITFNDFSVRQFDDHCCIEFNPNRVQAPETMRILQGLDKYLENRLPENYTQKKTVVQKDMERLYGKGFKPYDKIWLKMKHRHGHTKRNMMTTSMVRIYNKATRRFKEIEDMPMNSYHDVKKLNENRVKGPMEVRFVVEPSIWKNEENRITGMSLYLFSVELKYPDFEYPDMSNFNTVNRLEPINQDIFLSDSEDGFDIAASDSDESADGAITTDSYGEEFEVKAPEQMYDSDEFDGDEEADAKFWKYIYGSAESLNAFHIQKLIKSPIIEPTTAHLADYVGGADY